MLNEFERWLAENNIIGMFGSPEDRKIFGDAMAAAGVLARGKSNAKPDPAHKPGAEKYPVARAAVAKIGNILHGLKDEYFDFKEIKFADEAPTEEDKSWFVFYEWDIQVGDTAHWEIKFKANNNSQEISLPAVSFGDYTMREAVLGAMQEDSSYSKEAFESRLVSAMTRESYSYGYHLADDKVYVTIENAVKVTKFANRCIKKTEPLIANNINVYNGMIQQIHQLETDTAALRAATVEKVNKIYGAISDLKPKPKVPPKTLDDDCDDFIARLGDAR